MLCWGEQLPASTMQVSTPDELLQAALLPAEKIITNQSRSFYLLISTLLDESLL